MQAGCSKVFITSRKASACEEAVAALNALPSKETGAKAYSIPADSSKVSEIERLVKEVENHTDHVDILFANAGATWGSYFDKVDEKNGWDKVMDLNVKGVFFTIQKYVVLSTRPAFA
jgi:NAD(P)-dependent dehydrogenase (short-subunit alcohol dehydrogenase family)